MDCIWVFRMKFETSLLKVTVVCGDSNRATTYQFYLSCYQRLIVCIYEFSLRVHMIDVFDLCQQNLQNEQSRVATGAIATHSCHKLHQAHEILWGPCESCERKS